MTQNKCKTLDFFFTPCFFTSKCNTIIFKQGPWIVVLTIFLWGAVFFKKVFTREYTQCTAGYTFCFVVVVVVVVVVGGPLIKLASIWANS
jgi:hypothetical protein